jgi:hypothetical protein
LISDGVECPLTVRSDADLAGEQEVSIWVRRRTLDEDVVAFRLGFEHGARLETADLLVVEAQVERIGFLDEAVIADYGDAIGRCLLDGGPDGAGILARMMSASAPCEISDSTSVSCLDGDDWASAEIVAVAGSFERSSWKLDQEGHYDLVGVGGNRQLWGGFRSVSY